MSWEIVEGGPSAPWMVRMASSPVNKMNRAFFRDLHAALDELERRAPRSPVVLCSASPKAFCAGLDFEEVFPIFAGSDRGAIAAFFGELSGVYERLFSLPVPLAAAIEGPAVAGGFILACCADFRVAARGRARFAVNEVPLGIPMPAAYCELLAHVLGRSQAEQLILGGHFVDADEAQTLGIVHRVADPEGALETARTWAASIAPESIGAYRASKQALRQPTRERMAAAAARFDADLFATLSSADGVAARQHALQRLKQKSR